MKRNRDLITPIKPDLVLTPSTNHIYPALIEACRRDLYCFAMLCMAELNGDEALLHNFHLEALAFELVGVLEGRCPRLLVNLPPRYAKSIFVSIALPAYILGRDPTRRVFVISHSMDLAVKLSNDFRRIMSSAWYKAIFPHTQPSRMKNTENEIQTTKGGFRLAASLGGSLTGRGAHYLIFDDPLNAADAFSDIKRERVNELVRSTFTRLDDKANGVIIIAMQRLHADDPCGSLLRVPNHNWRLFSLAAIAEQDERIQVGEGSFHQRLAGEALHPERESLAVLQDLKSQIGSVRFAADYQQRPLPPDGLIFKRDRIQWYDAPPVRTSSSVVVQSWDTAIKSGGKNDYSACVTVMRHENKFYILDATRDRLDFPDLVPLAKSLAEKHKPDRIVIEESGVGNLLAKELERARLPTLVKRPQADKVTRMQAQLLKFEQHQVVLPRQAIWLADFLEELLSVPSAKHDDQVDALCQALAYGGSHSNFSWNKTNTGNFSKLVEGLAFNRYFGS
jgi:predicted phage terminase large subunit-like protein